MPLDTITRSSVCPHDCPSACALDVEVLDGARIGAVRGADNSYTSGVVCAKVARYAERAHHPDRLTHPLLRTGPKGSGQFTRIGWDEALGRIADAFRDTAAKHGKLAVWPYHSAGTMGLVQRDGIERLRNVMGYSRQKMTICTAIAAAGWQAGVGDIWGPDTREVAQSDLIVVWGGNPVSTQVNLMSHITRARKERGAKLVVIDPYRTPSAAAADCTWPCARARMRRWPAPPCTSPSATAMRTALSWPATPTARSSWRRTSPAAAPHGRPASPGSPWKKSRRSPGCTARRTAPSSASATASPAAAMVRPTCTPSPACRPCAASGGTRAAAPPGASAASTAGTRR